jgi:hypothetical protein
MIASPTVAPDKDLGQFGLDEFLITRRVLAAISNRQDPGDVSTLANPEVVDKIKELGK